MRIVHLSDVHASADRAHDLRVIVDALVRDLADGNEKEPVDLVVFSGDLAYHGRADEFQIACDEFMDPVLSAVSLGYDRLVLVPGNHDVEVDRIDEIIESGLTAKLTNRDGVRQMLAEPPAKLDLFLERIASYTKFEDEVLGSSPFKRVTPLVRAGTIPISDLRIGVMSLNSAWRATGAPHDGDMRNLVIGDVNVVAGLEAIADADLKIAVFHHPLDWLQPWDEDDLRRHFNKSVDLVLSGHTHRAAPTHLLSPSGSTVFSHAAAVHELRDTYCGYTVIEVGADSPQVKLWARRYYPERQEFDEATDIARGGVFTVERSLKSRAMSVASSTTVSFNEVMSALGAVICDQSVIANHIDRLEMRTVEELLIEPLFLPVPFAQAVAQADPGVRTRNARIDPMADLDDENCVVLFGGRESGLTSALVWLLARSHEATPELLPAYLPFGNISTSGKDPVARAVRAALAGHGFPTPKAPALPPCVVAVDDVDVNDRDRMARLQSHIEQHPTNLYILGAREDAQAELIAELTGCSFGFGRAFLGPFGRQELKDLVARLASEVETGLTDKILGLLAEQALPRTPFLMSAMVAVVASDVVEMDQLSETSLLERYVGLLLGRAELDPSTGLRLDFRHREDLLQHLAEWILQSQETVVSRAAAEDFVVRYFRERGLLSSALEVLQSLIDRRLLVEVDGQVGFRHPAIAQLFAAMRLLDSDEFRTMVVRSPLAYASVIRHAAAMSRKDRKLLDSIYEHFHAAVGVARQRLVGIDYAEVGSGRGWAAGPGMSELAARAQWAGPGPSEEEIERHKDEAWDAYEEQKSRSGAAEQSVQAELVDDVAPHLEEEDIVSSIDEFLEMVTLFSAVLSNSELIPDVPLKNERLKEVLHAWGLVLAGLAAHEDEEGTARTIFVDILNELKPGIVDEKSTEINNRLDRMAQVFVAASVAGWMDDPFGSSRIIDILDTALSDPELVDDPAAALLGWLVFSSLKGNDWVGKGRAIFERHVDNVVLRETLHSFAAYLYFALDLSAREERQVEDLCRDISVSWLQNRTPAQRRAFGTEIVETMRKDKLRQRGAAVTALGLPEAG